MAYYNPYVTQFTPQFNPYQMQQTATPAQQIQQPQQNNGQGFIWVQGEAGAKSFMVAPGSSVLLMDSDTDRFYMKSADASGMPTMRVFEYTEITQNAAKNAVNTGEQMTSEQFVTRKEYEDLSAKYDDILRRLDERPKRRTREDVNDG